MLSTLFVMADLLIICRALSSALALSCSVLSSLLLIINLFLLSLRSCGLVVKKLTLKLLVAFSVSTCGAFRFGKLCKADLKLFYRSSDGSNSCLSTLAESLKCTIFCPVTEKALSRFITELVAKIWFKLCV